MLLTEIASNYYDIVNEIQNLMTRLKYMLITNLKVMLFDHIIYLQLFFNFGLLYFKFYLLYMVIGEGDKVHVYNIYGQNRIKFSIDNQIKCHMHCFFFFFFFCSYKFWYCLFMNFFFERKRMSIHLKQRETKITN